MTDYVNPSNNFRPLSEEMGAVFRYSGHTPAFIADTSTTLVSDIDSVGVTDGPLGAFAKVSTSGLDFTIDTGEAMIEGALLARDTQTTVTLPESSSGTIYLAWDPSVENGLIIDHDGSGNVSGLPRTALYDFTTDASSVTGDTDIRAVGEHIGVRNDRYETGDGSGMSVDQADNASALGGESPSTYARLDQNETFNGDITINGRIDVEEEFSQIRIHESDTGQQWNVAVSSSNLNLSESGGDGLLQVEQGGGVRIDAPGSHIELEEIDTGATWRIEAQSNDFRVVEPGGDEWLRIDASQHNRVEAPGGMATQQMRLTPQSREPTSPQNGEMAVQDGTNWNPAGTGELDLVCYLGGVWELCSQPP